MNIGIIIAEYNPFHNGHAYQIRQLRCQGISHVAVVMSGHFVQRGDVSMFPKWTRARAALEAGADLVLDLPTSCAMTPATDFAAAGVFLASQFVGASLWFGSECGNLSLLRHLQQAVQQSEQSPIFRCFLEQGMSHPKAREQTVQTLYSAEYANMLRQPNNLLGIEYLRAIDQTDAPLTPCTLQRIGVEHDALSPAAHIASASFLRKLLVQQDILSWKSYVPSQSLTLYQKDIQNHAAPMKLDRLERMILMHLRQLPKHQLAKIPGVAEGLENRIIRLARESVSLDECIAKVTTRRYPAARIRRVIVSAVLEIEANRYPKIPQYLRVLACNTKGTELLRYIKPFCSIPIVSRFGQAGHLLQAQLEVKATDIAMLCAPGMFPAGLELKTPIYFCK